MRCENCGKETDGTSVLCPFCGERVDMDEATNEALINGDDLKLADEPDDEDKLAIPDDIAQPPTAETPEKVAKADPGPIEKAENTITEDRPTMSERLKTMAHDDKHPSEPAKDMGWTEGGFSGKAMRASFLLAILFTAPFIAIGIWLHTASHMPENSTTVLVIWCCLMILPLIYWCRLWCRYIYRVWTIKYRLTEFRFYHDEGIFKRVTDMLEVIDIEDLAFEQTLVDRFINGGVGTVTITSQDTSTPILKLYGLEDPQKVLNAIDESRRKQRNERGLKAI